MPEKKIKRKDISGRIASAISSRPVNNLNDFAPPYRQYIASLTCCSEQLQDLIESFPALLFALTTDYGTAERRGECVRLINGGATLREAAEALGLPLWLRKISAGALQQPFGMFPSEPEFNTQIINLIPKTETEIRYWLRRVLFACQAGDWEYGLWMARHKRFPFRDRAVEPHILLAAWVWFSRHPDAEGHKLMRKGWLPGMSLTRAYDEAKAWEQRLRMAVKLGNGLRDTWFEGGVVGEYQIVPLVTVDDFLNEAVIMGNCLDQYGDQLTREHARVFSIRLAGTHVADLEIGFHDEDETMPIIEQLRGPKNKRVGPEIWQTAYAWLGSQTFRPIKIGVKGGKQISSKVNKSIWKPYLDAIEFLEIREQVEDYALIGAKRPRRTGRLMDRMNLDLLVGI